MWYNVGVVYRYVSLVASICCRVCVVVIVAVSGGRLVQHGIGTGRDAVVVAVVVVVVGDIDV